MDEPPVVLAVPAVVLTMGYWVPTSITEVSLSRVTVRGEEITFVSAYVLRNDKTAFTPSAFRKKVLGERPRAVSMESPPDPPPNTEFRRVLAVELDSEEGVVEVVIVRPPGNVVVVVEGVPGVVVWLWVGLVPDTTPLPKLTCCDWRVGDQSTPFEVDGLTTVSSKRASMSTCRVLVSRRSISWSTSANSSSVATTTNWLVRTSGMTLSRLSSRMDCTLETTFEGLAYLSWIILVLSEGSAAGSLVVMRSILLLGSSINCKV